MSPPVSQQETQCEAFDLQVPPDSKPGVSQFGFTPPEANFQLLITLPPEWTPGDHLRVSKDDSKNWCVHLVQLKLEEFEPREFKFFIPSWAVPGESRFKVSTGGGETLMVSAPAFSRPGDQMVFKYGDDGWHGTVMKETLVRHELPKMDCLKNMRPFRAPPMHPNQNFQELAQAVKAAGGFLSPKVTRGSLPPLHIPGLVALEAVDDGEVLMRIPRRLQIHASSAEAIAPKLAAELKALPDMRRDKRAERTLQGVLVAQLLHEAETRTVTSANAKDCANGNRGEEDPFKSAFIDPDVRRVWEAYADGLLGTDFSSHRYFQAAQNLEALRAELEPSTQADFLIDMASDLDKMYSTLKSHCSWAALDDAMLFVQARLCMATRTFDAQGSAALIPLSDLFNHMPNPGVLWAWNSDEDAMDYTACRSHSAGEELFISYGSRSNLKLHQGYGFTLPPQLEESWSYELRPERVNLINEAYLPKSQWQLLISFDSKRLDNSLLTALNEVSGNGKSPAEFLALVCARCKAAYDTDPCMSAALGALKRARARRVGSHAWWDEFDGDASDLSSDGIRIKMGEYLCLVAHLEAEGCWRGVLPEEQCLENAAQLRMLVKDALQVLAEGAYLGLSKDTIPSV